MSARLNQPLTIKQQAFVDAYAGNIKEAAKIAGFTYDYGRVLITKHHGVITALQERTNGQRKPTIASREERQEFWSTVMRDDDPAHRDRLKASELLGRSEKDFTDKIEIGLADGEPIAIRIIRGK